MRAMESIRSKWAPGELEAETLLESLEMRSVAGRASAAGGMVTSGGSGRRDGK